MSESQECSIAHTKPIIIRRDNIKMEGPQNEYRYTFEMCKRHSKRRKVTCAQSVSGLEYTEKKAFLAAQEVADFRLCLMKSPPRNRSTRESTSKKSYCRRKSRLLQQLEREKEEEE